MITRLMHAKALPNNHLIYLVSTAYMHVSAFTPHQCSFVRAWIRDG